MWGTFDALIIIGCLNFDEMKSKTGSSGKHSWITLSAALLVLPPTQQLYLFWAVWSRTERMSIERNSTMSRRQPFTSSISGCFGRPRMLCKFHLHSQLWIPARWEQATQPDGPCSLWLYEKICVKMFGLLCGAGGRNRGLVKLPQDGIMHVSWKEQSKFHLTISHS